MVKKKILLGSLALCVLFATSSCNSTSKTTYKQLNGEWEIMEIEGKKIEKDLEEKPFIGFKLDEARLYGLAGCNRLVGGVDTVALAKGEISFDKVGMTRMMCPDMKVEDQLTQAMPKISNFEIKNETELVLLDTQKNKIVLLKKRK